jgi:hypothetical protein
MKSTTVRWERHVKRIREERKLFRFWMGSLNKRDHLEDQGTGGRMGSE